MNQHLQLIQRIMAHIFGKKYYANIIITRGTNRHEIASFIFHNKEEARQHRQRLEDNRSFKFIETISFRSRKDY